MGNRRFLKFPSILYIEPTNDCNLNCIMCARKKSRKEIGYMSLDLYRNIVDQLSGQKISQLTLHLTGEPLLHPGITEMIRYAKDKGLPYVRFATNATLLNDELARNLIDSGLDSLTVSMDSLIAGTYCPAQKRDEVFAKLDENIRHLLEIRNRKNRKHPEVIMQIIDMEKTRDLMSEFVKKWRGIADHVTVKKLLSWGGQIRIHERRSPNRLICINHLTQGVVHWDGAVSFCCLYIDSHGNSDGMLGNAAQTPLQDIFLGEKRQQIIETHLRGNYDSFPYCKKCPDWDDLLDYVRNKEKTQL
ncbi:MAG: radical SAM/SPASM domain-containing protein [Candidatus Aminicenantales bacterium]